MSTHESDTKPTIETKSSMEILSELFSTFHAEPPVIIKEELSRESKKHKRKKKHKSKDKKDKKYKKKGRKRKRSSNSNSSATNGDSSSEIEFDFAKLLVKQEKEHDEKKIKIEGTDLSLSLDRVEGETFKDDVDSKPCREELKKHVDEKIEDGEIPSDHDRKKCKHKKHKSKHKHNRNRADVTPEKSREKRPDDSKIENKSRHGHRSKSRDNTPKGRDESNSFYKMREWDDRRERSRSPIRQSISRYKERDDYRNFSEVNRRSRYNSFYGKNDPLYKLRDRSRSYDRNDNNDFYKSRPRSVERNRDDRWYSYKRSGETSRERKYRDRDTSMDKEYSYIDKKKLLEIARKNAIQMMKSGSLPGALTLGRQAQEKVIAAIKAGGKTIEELTDFCKTLSKKEDLGELSDEEDVNGSESDNDKPFNHPFQIKDRPTTITMNIKNSVPLPIKSTQERSSELRMQFPVSSGQHHRKNEHEWVPVDKKKQSTFKPSITLTKEVFTGSPSVPPVDSSQFLPTSNTNTQPAKLQEPQPSPIDISTIVSQRLSVMRKLQENPLDVSALTQVYKASKEVQSWAESKQQPGQFTGSVSGTFLSQSELSSGYQAWAKKDQLQIAAPVSGGMGMHLLQKMGWKPGEGLGKEKTGALEPLLLEVKLDKKGLVANEETQKKKKTKPVQQNAKIIQDKHPVSLLGEYACKKKLGVPTYQLCFECGPDHKKNFLFKVILNGMEYKPNVASPNKKEAKANAATLCLQKLGIIPT